MASRLKRREPVVAGFIRLLRRELKAVDAALRDEEETPEERTHIARRRLKKARSLVAALAPAIGRRVADRERRRLRDAARLLSQSRDADVAVKTVRDLIVYGGDEAAGPLERLLAVLEARAAEARTRSSPLEPAGEEVRRAIEIIETLAAKSDGDAKGEKHPGEKRLRKALGNAYDAGRETMAVAMENSKAEAFHEWRKAVKHRAHLTGFAARRLAAASPPVITALDRLGDILGDANDLSVVEEIVAGEPEIVGTPSEAAIVIGVITRRREELRAQAFVLGEALFGQGPRRFRRGLHAPADDTPATREEESPAPSPTAGIGLAASIVRPLPMVSEE